MNAGAISHTNTPSRTTVTPVEKTSRTKHLCVAGVCISGGLGMLSALSGLGIGAATILRLVNSSSGLKTMGTILIAASFPLMVVAAHFMDLVHRSDKTIRAESAQPTGDKRR